jgi:hypothetical protein
MMDNENVRQAAGNVLACAWNAAVNSDSERGRRKMRQLIEALNLYHRIEGREKLRALVDRGVIEGFKACPAECEMRPGGLFHAPECENDMNHPVYRERTRLAREKLSGPNDGRDGYWEASVSLVGDDLNVGDYYHRKNIAGMVRGLSNG